MNEVLSPIKKVFRGMLLRAGYDINRLSIGKMLQSALLQAGYNVHRLSDGERALLREMEEQRRGQNLTRCSATNCHRSCSCAPLRRGPFTGLHSFGLGPEERI
jgi:hypothetical protein